VLLSLRAKQAMWLFPDSVHVLHRIRISLHFCETMPTAGFVVAARPRVVNIPFFDPATFFGKLLPCKQGSLVMRGLSIAGASMANAWNPNGFSWGVIVACEPLRPGVNVSGGKRNVRGMERDFLRNVSCK
jgi:hypothetical protein